MRELYWRGHNPPGNYSPVLNRLRYSNAYDKDELDHNLCREQAQHQQGEKTVEIDWPSSPRNERPRRTASMVQP